MELSISQASWDWKTCSQKVVLGPGTGRLGTTAFPCPPLGSRIDLESLLHPLAVSFPLVSLLPNDLTLYTMTMDCEWEQLQEGSKAPFCSGEPCIHRQILFLGPVIWIRDRSCASSRLEVFCILRALGISHAKFFHFPAPEILLELLLG